MINPLAYIHPDAKLDPTVKIDPFTVIHKNVEIGEGTWIGSNVTIMEGARIGKNCRIFPGAVLSAVPQDLKFAGEKTEVVIGDNTTIREFVTIHRGTRDSWKTVIGSHCLIMAYSHIAHDCIVGNNVTFANLATLAGHCEIGDNVIIGGMTAVHQFVRIGHHAFLGGCSAIIGDVIPYGLAEGNKARLRGFNIIGMKRSGFARADLAVMRQAYRVIFDRQHPIVENLERAAAEFSGSGAVIDIIDFMRSRGKRYFIVPPHGEALPDDDAGQDG